MSDQGPTGPARLDVRPVKQPIWRRLSLVWIVPIIALAASLYTAWLSYRDLGVLITISFENAEGVTAGDTKIRYRDVVVGDVEDVEFAEGLTDVLVHARVKKEIAPYLDDDAEFWVVRPDVSVRGITGLDTVLSGVYIEGNWDTQADVAQNNFVGLERAALTLASQRGVRITLRAADGSALSAGAPVLHKGIQVGYLETPELSLAGNEVQVNAFIESPYDRRITTNTRFWDTSGFSVRFGAGGVSLDVNSLASLIEGGVAFDTIVSGGQRVRDGHVFSIFDEEEAARDSLFADPDAETLQMAVLFEESVSGLTEGSEVRFQGIRIGEVSDLNAIVVGEGDSAQVRLQAVLSIEPSRLGMGADATPQTALALLSDFVTRGLRARMVTGNILSGALFVELVQVDDALPAIVTLTSGDYPVIPTTDSEISDVAATAEGLLSRVNNLPVEELLNGAIDMMDSIEALANDDATRAAPASLVALLEDARGLVTADDTQAIPGDLRAAINDLNAILGDAADEELVSSLRVTLDNTSALAANLNTATENLPEIMAQIEALTVTANALVLEDLINNANKAMAAIDQLASNEDTQALPSDLRASITNLNKVITEFANENIVADLGSTLDSANMAANNIAIATEDLPAIIEEIEALAAKANALELQELVNNASETLAAIDQFVDSDDTRALPGRLNSALDEVRFFLQEVREGGAIQNVNAALAAANDAAQAIEDSVQTLPGLSERAGLLVSETRAVINAYSDRSRFNAETLQTLRDIQEASDAVSALARAIQRNPNSLLTGR